MPMNKKGKGVRMEYIFDPRRNGKYDIYLPDKPRKDDDMIKYAISESIADDVAKGIVSSMNTLSRSLIKLLLKDTK